MARVRYVGPYDQVMVAVPGMVEPIPRMVEIEVDDDVAVGLCEGDFELVGSVASWATAPAQDEPEDEE